ncbi:MAG: LURP-one-related family protein [Lutisporaceae bacterium]
MKYLIRQRIFSFGDNFTIKDEMEQDRYIVRGKVFSFGDKLKIEDLNGNELFFIEQQVFRFLPEYYIYAGGQQVASVKKQLTFFTPKFVIDSTYGSYDIDGDIFGYDFQINKNGIMVASINKKWFSFSDSYGIEIVDGEDHAFLLTLAIVIDQVLHDEKKR